MRGVKRNGHEGLTLLELVRQLEGDIRRRLAPIRVTPLQAGVILFLRRHADAKLTDAATVLRVRLPTMSTVVKNLVRKRWVTRHRSVTDTRVVSLSLSRRGSTLARQIEQRVRQVNAMLTEQDRRSPGHEPEGHPRLDPCGPLPSLLQWASS
jgi:DNA-binding MarR family transcriptional regulator